MSRITPLTLAAAAALMFTTSALADPIAIGRSDEGYSRLARWEQHLDDQIAAGVRNRSLNPKRAWQIQKSLDSIEAHVLQSYYQSGNGIDRRTFRRYAAQLRDIGNQLGDTRWAGRNVFGNGWYDDSGAGAGFGRDDRGYGDDRDGDRPPPRNYYREGDYERSCHQGNVAAGTIFGAIAGGLIGSAASHGNGGAVAGGVILGGLLGNTLSRDIDCDDQRYAFNSYNDGLNGDVGREYDWRHNDNYGTFEPTREYRDGGYICRDFHTVSYRNGQRLVRDGTACRQDDGYWHFR